MHGHNKRLHSKGIYAYRESIRNFDLKYCTYEHAILYINCSNARWLCWTQVCNLSNSHAPKVLSLNMFFFFVTFQGEARETETLIWNTVPMYTTPLLCAFIVVIFWPLQACKLSKTCPLKLTLAKCILFRHLP